MIYVTGDMHGEHGKLLAAEKEVSLQEGDLLIVCGDFGYIFKDNKQEQLFLDEIETRPYTLCFVDGNHENFEALYRYPQQDWNGGQVHRIRNNIFHLMRGQIYEIDGKSIFTMGGAYSIDKYFRTEGLSWWPEELPNREEYDTAIRNLLGRGKKVDYVFTHTMPYKTIWTNGWFPDPHDRELTGFLEWILYEIQYKHWFCGHFHVDMDLLPERISILLDLVRPME